MLGLLFVVIALTTDLIWALVAGTAGAVLRRSRTFLRVQRYVSGTIFVGLGALAATTGRSHDTRDAARAAWPARLRRARICGRPACPIGANVQRVP